MIKFSITIFELLQQLKIAQQQKFRQNRIIFCKNAK